VKVPNRKRLNFSRSAKNYFPITFIAGVNPWLARVPRSSRLRSAAILIARARPSQSWMMCFIKIGVAGRRHCFEEITRIGPAPILKPHRRIRKYRPNPVRPVRPVRP
jgi:hypothetical protein